ncbi:hypothetical protein VRY85_09940 [Achromobacter sp. F4_2707]|uniref:hypothetical protein n=1 Tax=Achromobacter sp. F4_2707 TaxID=3114286 RepID=UPI0039C5C8B0
MSELTFPAGTLVYHGTDRAEADEVSVTGRHAFWLTTTLELAQNQALRNRSGSPRVFVYRLNRDLTLPAVRSPADVQALLKKYELWVTEDELLQASAIAANLAGWAYPDSNPLGVFLKLFDTRMLEYVETQVVDRASVLGSTA